MVDFVDEDDSGFQDKQEKSKKEKRSSSSSSSDSDSESDVHKNASLNVSSKKRLFGRQKPIHLALGGGQPANIMLWRNKRISAGIFAGATVIWLLFVAMGYHLLTFICHSMIFILAALFLWSHLASFFNISPPQFSELTLREDVFTKISLFLIDDLNRALTAFRHIAYGSDVKKFLLTILALWILSVVGSWFSFLTTFYLVFVILLTVPKLYENNEDTVDAYAGKGFAQIKRQCSVIDEKVLQKIPSSRFSRKQR